MVWGVHKGGVVCHAIAIQARQNSVTRGASKTLSQGCCKTLLQNQTKLYCRGLYTLLQVSEGARHNVGTPICSKRV